MQKMKGIFTLFLALIMVTTTLFPVVQAADTYTYTQEAQKLNDLGLYKGISDDTFDPDLGTALNRETGVVMLLRIFGLEADANALTDADDILAKFSDAASISDWAKNAVAYSVKNGLVLGLPDGTFGPKDALNGKAYATLILRQLGFTPDYNGGPAELAEKGGLTPDEATKFAGKELVKDDLVGISFGSLSATDKEGKRVIEALVAEQVVDEQAAIDAGLIEPVTIPVVIETVSPLSSKVLEVGVSNALEASDLVGATFKLVDSAAKELVVESATMAGYDSTKKTILLKLDRDTSAGTLYQLTHGTVTLSFGGKGMDVEKPTVTSVLSTDYNEVTVEFSEPILLNGTISFVKDLSVVAVQYVDKYTLKVITSEQKDGSLYRLNAIGFTDYAGNAMEDLKEKAFAGKSKSTLKLALVNAKALDYNQIYLELNEKVDFETLTTAAIKVEDISYTAKNVPIASQAAASYMDTESFNSENDTDAERKAAAQKGIVITLAEGMGTGRLYSVTLESGLKTVYGLGLSTETGTLTKKFAGVSKLSTPFMYGETAAAAINATTIKVVFERKVDPQMAKDTSHYTITESYGAKTSLVIEKAVLQADGKTVYLTVSQMKYNLYKLLVKDMKDIYGNSQKGEPDSVVLYAGITTAAKISEISSFTRISDTQIKLIFNQKVGKNATDVSNYSINNNVGYPERVQIDTDSEYGVILTIPKTRAGTTYVLTVKNVLNSDGIAMDAAGVQVTFAGKGIDGSIPQILSILTLDAHSIKVTFDTEIMSNTVNGVLWNATTGAINNFFEVKANKTGAVNSPINGLNGYQDSGDKYSLIIIDDTATFSPGEGYSTFYLNVADAYGSKLSLGSGVTRLEFAANDKNYQAPQVLDIVGIDNHTVKIVFDKGVSSVSGNVQIVLASDIETNLTEGTGKAVPGSMNAIWLIPITQSMSANLYQATFTTSAITDQYVTATKLDDENTNVLNAPLVKTFASTGAATGAITDVNCLMTDSRTIQVFYPEEMYYIPTAIDNNADIAAVDSIGNYVLKDMDGESALSGNTPAIGHVMYDPLSKKATLYLTGEIDTSESIFSLVINTNMSNLTSTKTIGKSDTNDAALAVHIANNKYVLPEAPRLTDVVVSANRLSMTIYFSDTTAIGLMSNYTIDSDATLGANELPAKNTGSGYDVPTATLLKAIAIYGTNASQGTGFIGANNIASANLAPDGKSITLVFEIPFSAGSTGYVTTKVGAVDTSGTLFGYTKVAHSQTENESKVTFSTSY